MNILVSSQPEDDGFRGYNFGICKTCAFIRTIIVIDNSSIFLFQNHLMDSLEISILEAEKRANPVLNIRDFFTAYLIETK